LNSLTEIIKGARTEELPERISDLLNKMKDIEKVLATLRSSSALAQVGELAKKVNLVNGFSLITSLLPDGINSEDLRKISIEVRGKLKNSVVALISSNDGKPVLVVAVSEEAKAAGIKAGALVKIGSSVLGGGGGGKDDFAQGGGIDPSKSNEALSAISSALAG
jgi:alanyl-tRNA synthetase